MGDENEPETQEDIDEAEFEPEPENWEDEEDSFEYVECFLKDDVSFIIEVRHDWAPLGAARFMELVKDGYFTHCPLFRAVKDFLVQFGLSADEEMREKWRKVPNLEDDPLLDMPFTEGMMSFAGGGKNTRGTQMFITLGKEVGSLGKELWETPFGKVIYGMEYVQDINFEYGDSPPWGKGPDQQKIWSGGQKYLEDNFPNLSYIQSCESLEINYDDLGDDYLAANFSYQEYLEEYYNHENVLDPESYEYEQVDLNDFLGKRKLEAYPVPGEALDDYGTLKSSLVLPFSIAGCFVAVILLLWCWVNKKKSRLD